MYLVEGLDLMENRATINKLIPFSNVDGPGNRYAVFLQGCNIHCIYCHNHETINICNHCGKCVEACQYEALQIINDKVTYNESKCQKCDSCIMACEFNASPKVNVYGADEVFEDIKKYKAFIRGITVSGGEPTLHKDFIIELFNKVKGLGLSCFVDTNGFFDFEENLDLIDVTDKFMMDIKTNNAGLMDLCGTTMLYPIDNLKKLLTMDKIYEVRTVIIEDKNIEDVVQEVAKILEDYPHVPYRLIKVHLEGLKEDQKLLLKDRIPSDSYMDKLNTVTKGKS